MKVSSNVLNYKTGQNYNTFVKNFNSENKIYAKNSNDFVVNSPVYNLNFLGNINALNKGQFGKMSDSEKYVSLFVPRVQAYARVVARENAGIKEVSSYDNKGQNFTDDELQEAISRNFHSLTTRKSMWARNEHGIPIHENSFVYALVSDLKKYDERIYNATKKYILSEWAKPKDLKKLNSFNGTKEAKEKLETKIYEKALADYYNNPDGPGFIREMFFEKFPEYDKDAIDPFGEVPYTPVYEEFSVYDFQ